MIFPPLPTVGETPWHAKRAAWDATVESGLNAVESSASAAGAAAGVADGKAVAAQTTANTAQAGVTAAAAREYWGPGRPDVAGSLDSAGTAWVAAATSGAVFRSTNGPQGAWEWLREGSTWVCVRGETPWVDMPRFATVDDAGTNAITWTSYRMKRVDRWVYTFWHANTAVALSTAVNASLAPTPPAGWATLDRASGHGYMPVYASANMSPLAGRCIGFPSGRMSGQSLWCSDARPAELAWPLATV